MNLQQRIHERINDLEERHPGMFDLAVTGFSVAPSKRGAGPGQSLYVSTADASGIGFELPLLPGDDVAALQKTFELVH